MNVVSINSKKERALYDSAFEAIKEGQVFAFIAALSGLIDLGVISNDEGLECVLFWFATGK